MAYLMRLLTRHIHGQLWAASTQRRLCLPSYMPWGGSYPLPAQVSGLLCLTDLGRIMSRTPITLTSKKQLASDCKRRPEIIFYGFWLATATQCVLSILRSRTPELPMPHVTRACPPVNHPSPDGRNTKALVVLMSPSRA